MSLSVDHLSVSYEGRRVLDDVSLQLASGEIIALVGPSGSGKSTLLRAIAGIVLADHGTVCIDGVDVSNTPIHRRGVGFLFQDDQLFPHYDVAANIGFGLRMAKVDKRTIKAHVSELLSLVGLVGFERRRVTDLSGGEAKRVALARTLAPRPHIVLFDEPLTGLDRELHDQLAIDLARIFRATQATAIVVTHDVGQAALIADRVVALADLNSRA